MAARPARVIQIDAREVSAGTRNALTSGAMLEPRHIPSFSVAGVDACFSLGIGAALLIAGLRRRSLTGLSLAISSAPFLYRGVAHYWPGGGTDTRAALGGDRGLHVRESITIARTPADVYRFWRRLENLPRVMSHLESVTEQGNGRSRWVARGPLNVKTSWDAEIINDVEDHLIAWQSLPGSEVATAGSVTFDPIGDGSSTSVSVHLQYSPPAGKTGAFLASMLGRDPARAIRSDLQRLDEVLS